MAELKKITKETTHFTANGKKYVIADGVSIARFEEYEKLQPILAYGINHKEIFTHLRKAWDYLNKNKPIDAGVILHNVMSGIENVDKEDRVHPGLLIAALFINREDEDLSKYDKNISLDKIKDWREEGYDVSSFFLLALNSLQGFKQTYVEYINQIKQEVLEIKE